MCPECVLVPTEALRGLRSPWNWSYRQLQSCGCWELNPSPLEEQRVLWTTEPSLQPRGLCCHRLIRQQACRGASPWWELVKELFSLHLELLQDCIHHNIPLASASEEVSPGLRDEKPHPS